MKTYATFFLTFLLTASAFAQRVGWEYMVFKNSGVRVWVYRNTGVYPETAAGNAALYADANAGKLLTVYTDPKSVPASVKVRLTLSSNLLYIEGAGDLAQIKFERTDGAALTGSNPDGVSLQSGVFYGYGSNSDPPYDKQWKANFGSVSGKSLRLTFKQASGGTFSYAFIAPKTGSVDRTPLFYSGSGTVVNPPTSVTTTPASNTALAFTIVSYNCQNGILQWKFTSPNSGAINVNWNGVFGGTLNPGDVQTTNLPSDRWVGGFYSGTASQAGQANTSFNFTTSCSLGPTVTPPTTVTTTPGSTTTAGFLTYSHQGVGNIQTLETSKIKVDFYLNLGGIPSFIYNKERNNEQLIWTPNGVFMGDSLDGGGSFNVSQYMTPLNTYTVKAHTNENGIQVPAQTISGDYSTGFNTVPGGSYNQARSKLYKWRKLQTSDRGQVLCMQVRPVMWNPLGVHNSIAEFSRAGVFANVLLNFEYWIVGERTLSWKVQTVIEPRNPLFFDPGERQFLPFSQEYPTVYPLGPYFRHVYRLNGNDVETQGSGEELKHVYPDDFAFLHCNGDLSSCLTLYTPSVGRYKSSAIPPPQSVNKFESNPELNFDYEQTHLSTGSLIIGSRAQALATIPTLPNQPSQAFDFNFLDDSHDWYNGRGTMKRVNGKLEFVIGTSHYDNGQYSYDASVRSPFRRWEASRIQNLYLTAAFTGGTTSAKLFWQKRNADGSITGYTKPFTVIGDGVERTYTIPTADNNFNGIIIQIGIQAGDNTPDGAKLILNHIKKGDCFWILVGAGSLLRRRKTLSAREQKPKGVSKTRLVRTLVALLLLPMLAAAQPPPSVSALPAGFTGNFYRDNAIRIRLEYPAGTTQASGLLKKGPNLSPASPQPVVIDSSATGLTLYWVDAKGLPTSGWLQISLNNTRVAAGTMNVGYQTGKTSDTLRFVSSAATPTLRFVLPGMAPPAVATARSIWARLMDLYYSGTTP